VYAIALPTVSSSEGGGRLPAGSVYKVAIVLLGIRESSGIGIEKGVYAVKALVSELEEKFS
jgi:hypothetical protein